MVEIIALVMQRKIGEQGVMREAKFIDVEGIRTRYFEAGSGEHLLLLHGGNFGDDDNVDCADNWARNWDGFARSFHVIAIDKLGQGHTDNPRPGNYKVESVVAHAQGFIRALGLDRLNLVGHSRGGYLAMRLTMEPVLRPQPGGPEEDQRRAAQGLSKL